MLRLLKEVIISGHSKWSQIKRQKGAADQKRGQLFGKLTNAIIIAARQGGGDPETNLTLKIAIEKARLANMPKDNIDRAISRGTGILGGAQIEEGLYEVFGPQGTGILIEIATDNKNRTNSEVKNILNKFGAKLTGSGAVSYQFERMGKLLISVSENNREEIELAIIESGAEDFGEQEDAITVYTKALELMKIKKILDSQNIRVQEASLTWEPKTIINIEDSSQAQKIIQLMETIDGLDDVVAVYSNFDINPSLITNQTNN